MSLDNALFLVDRGGTNYHSKGSDIGDRIRVADKVLVQRNGQRFKAIYDGNEWTQIQDDDLLLAWDGTKNRRVTGANFKSLFWNPPSFPAGFEVVAEHPDGGGDFWFLVNEIIALRFYGKEPGTTEQDYIDAYDVETIFTQSSENFLTLYTDVMHTPQWCVYSTKQNINSLLPVTVETKWTNKKDPTDVRRFITSLTLSRSTAREDALLDQAQECHRQAYEDYLGCKLLCETDYCQSICDSMYEEAVNGCYQTRGLTAPARIAPPPRA